MNILICLLGLSPGVATGAYYALARDRGITIDHLVTLTTSHPQASDCEREIERELQNWNDEQSTNVRYDGLPVLLSEPEPSGNLHDYRQLLKEQMVNACRLRMSYDDVNTEPSVIALREAMRALVSDLYRDDEVYMCVAGGRKSMSAIAAIATQLYGYSVKGMYHLFVQRDIEEDGLIDTLNYLPEDRKRRVLRPMPDEVRLIDLPFFQLTVNEGRPELTLRGQMQDYMLDYLSEYPDLVVVLEPDTRDDILGYIFETQVCNYLRGKGYNAEQSKLIAGFKGDIDVYAKRADEILICECKFRQNPVQPIPYKAVEQVIMRMEAVSKICSKRKIMGWIVSNASSLEDGINQWPIINSYNGQIQVMRFPLRDTVVRSIEGQRWAARLRERWFDEERITTLSSE